MRVTTIRCRKQYARPPVRDKSEQSATTREALELPAVAFRCQEQKAFACLLNPEVLRIA